MFISDSEKCGFRRMKYYKFKKLIWTAGIEKKIITGLQQKTLQNQHDYEH